MNRKQFILSAGALLVSMATTTTALAAEKVLIATYGEPIPAQVAAHDGSFKKATGWDVDWRKFTSGTDVIAAMASGDISIAELGSSPLAIAATQGVDLKVFMIDFVIGDSESLIVRDGSGIAELKDLKGKRIAVPIGSTAHFSLMGALKKAGLGENEVTILNMPPDQIVAAWQQSAVDAAFIWPPAQTEILKSGKRLVSANDVAKWGYPTFNTWVVNKEFAESNKESLEAFIRVVEESNQSYLKDPSAWDADSEPIKAIATEIGAQPDQVVEVIKGYTFLPLDEQASPEWLGKLIPDTIKETADFLVSAGRLSHASDDYTSVIDLQYMNNAMK